MKIYAALFLATVATVRANFEAADDYGIDTRSGTCPTATSDAYSGDKCTENSDCTRPGECCLGVYCICGKTNTVVGGNVQCVPGGSTPATSAPTKSPTSSPGTTDAPTASPTSTSQQINSITCGVPNKCTASVLLTDAGDGDSCGEKIVWTMNAYGKTENQACYQVAVDDHNNKCGDCNPGGNGNINYSFDCGASDICTDPVLNTYANGARCGDRITFLKNIAGQSEQAACAKVAGEEYPVECGECIKGAITCNGASGCAAVLDTKAGDHTCRDRISWLVYDQGMTEQQACQQVATEAEASATCGPCNPP